MFKLIVSAGGWKGLQQLTAKATVLTRLPTHPNSRIEELLPTRWQPEASVAQ